MQFPEWFDNPGRSAVGQTSLTVQKTPQGAESRRTILIVSYERSQRKIVRQVVTLFNTHVSVLIQILSEVVPK